MRDLKFKVYHRDYGMSEAFSLTAFDIQITFDDSSSYYELATLPCGSVFLQYTGLKDSKDKEIYEDDIIELNIDYLDEPAIDKVVWNYGNLQWQFNEEDDPLVEWGDYAQIIRVIGSVHTAPELLEANK